MERVRSRPVLLIILLFLLLLLCIFLLWWFFLFNRPPVAVDDVFTVLANTAVSDNLLANDSDPNGDALLATTDPMPVPTNGTLSLLANGDFTYTPRAEYVGPDQFTYEVCDPSDACATANVSITVAPTSTVPVMAADDVFTTTVDTAVSGNVLANDLPAGELTADTTLTTPPSNGTFGLAADGNFTYTPNSGFTGSDTVTYQACDESSVCDTANVVINVVPAGAVIANDDAFETMINTAVSGNVLANDLPAGQLTADPTLVAPPSNGTFDLAADGNFTYTPNSGFGGTDTVTYQACDASSVCDSATVTIIVKDDGTPSQVILANDIFTTTVNMSVSGNVLSNDMPQGGLTANTTLVTPPSSGVFNLGADGNFTYTPNSGFGGTDTVTYQACDASSVCDSAIVTLVVTDGDTPSQLALANDTFTTTVNMAVSGNVLSNDVPQGGLTANTTLATAPTNGTFNLAADGNFTYTPTSDFEGTDTVKYEACLTGSSTCATADVTLRVEKEGGGSTEAQHEVKEGEWLLQIARCYGTSPESIVANNDIPYPSWIYPGVKLKITNIGSVSEPFFEACIMHYTVQTGDTLTDIAALFKVPLDTLNKANNGCYGYNSYYHYFAQNGYYGYGYHSPNIYSGCDNRFFPWVYPGQVLIIPVNLENKELRPSYP